LSVSRHDLDARHSRQPIVGSVPVPLVRTMPPRPGRSSTRSLVPALVAGALLVGCAAATPSPSPSPAVASATAPVAMPSPSATPAPP